MIAGSGCVAFLTSRNQHAYRLSFHGLVIDGGRFAWLMSAQAVARARGTATSGGGKGTTKEPLVPAAEEGGQKPAGGSPKAAADSNSDGNDDGDDDDDDDLVE